MIAVLNILLHLCSPLLPRFNGCVFVSRKHTLSARRHSRKQNECEYK